MAKRNSNDRGDSYTSELKYSSSVVEIDKAVLSYFRDIESSEPLSRERELELSYRIRDGDISARDELVEANLRFAVHVAKEPQYQNRGVSLADLISAANVGLVVAAGRFNGERNYKFISYAVWWIRQGITHTIYEQGRLVRLPLSKLDTLRKIKNASNGDGDASLEEIAEELDKTEKEIQETLREGKIPFSLYSYKYNEKPTTMLEELSQEDIDESARDDSYTEEGVMREVDLLALTERLDGTLEILNESEKRVIGLYYGLRGSPMTLEAIGSLMGRTRERVRQIKERALQKLRHPNHTEHLKEFLEMF